MKTFCLLPVLIISCLSLQAQTSNIDSTIRALEKQEVKAVLQRDTSVLKGMWAPDYTVNSPMNGIQGGGKSTLDRPVLRRTNYLKFDRNIEKILVKGDVVISMGNELLVEKGTNGQPGRTIKRRYTNTWMKQNNAWQLIARHANEICQ